jgi:asparagine synthase (glutamine-hydrolysing)
MRIWPGLFEDTLYIAEPVALAHIDCDWYQSVMLCLERITPHLIPGGVLVIDDYRDWAGCKRAVDEYFTGRGDEFRFVMRARLHIERRPTTL